MGVSGSFPSMSGCCGMGSVGQGGTKDSQDAFTEGEVIAALAQRDITDPRVISGLMIAFDRDRNGHLDSNEIQEMLNRVDQINAMPPSEDTTPADCKAIISLAQTAAGPSSKPGNPKLKMFLTTAGLMPGSSKTLKDSFKALKAVTPGKGVLYLIDARLEKLQFHFHNADPEKHSKQKHVAYRRSPDTPGGKPVRDAKGNLEMKSQDELMKLGAEGYAGVAYNLRHRGHYANGHLEPLVGGEGNTAVPVYVAYLWYNGEVENGKFVHSIFLAKGLYKQGRFSAVRTDGKEFTEEDYNVFQDYSAKADHWFKEVSGTEFGAVFDEVQCVYAVGGIPFIPLLHFQPKFIDETHKVASQPNPYGLAILEAVKAGKVTYVGMSAGAMAWGWTMGPLTTDPQRFMLHDLEAEDGDDVPGAKVDVNLAKELGSLWMFPGLGEYVGIPYEITLKAHVHFNAETCSFGGTAAQAEKVGSVVCAIANKSHYAALLTDYDWYEGQGDALEISEAKLFFHVGFSDKEDPLPAEWQNKLAKYSGASKAKTIRRQPPGVPKEGFKFEWTPAQGEVICAGSKATHRPFRMYADSNGPLPDQHPAYGS